MTIAQLRAESLLNRSIKITCIVPVYNEEAVIAIFLKALCAQLEKISNSFEIIIIDDGSRDNTVSVVRSILHDYPIKLLAFSRNFGKEIALTAGLDHASGDVAILMDADFQHPIEMIPDFLAKWADGIDMVYGIRRDRESETYLKRTFARFFYWIMKRITNINIPSHAGDFRLLDKKIIQALCHFPERTRFMKGLYAWVGFSSMGLPFSVKERVAGQSSWRFRKLTELAITGITSFSDVPLRVWGWIGFIISCFSLVYALYIIAVTLIYGTDLPGFPTLVVAIMFLGGIQLLSVGILGEYIARIFTEVKQRPRYLLAVKEGFDEN